MNQLPHAIHLPPVNRSQEVIVGGPEDVVLTIPGFEGLQMVVRANSVTFPDGSRVGPLVVSPVHNDRLPMVPPAAAGRFETVGWTIQPTNTRFDPPIEVRIPNSSGLKPGQTMPIVQWDHDLAVFVPMGNGTVSEDGTQIVTEFGSGITKAGWGGGPPPIPQNTACGPNPVCTECEELGQGTDGCPVCQLRMFGGPSSKGGMCQFCPVLDPYPTVTLTADGKQDDLTFGYESTGDPDTEGAQIRLNAQIDGDCLNPSGRWTIGSDTVIGQSVSYQFSDAREYAVEFVAICGECRTEIAPETIDITVVKLDLGEPTEVLTMMESESLHASVVPEGSPAPTDIIFEIQDANGSWFTLSRGNEEDYELTTRVAGDYKLRARAQVGNVNLETESYDLEVRFPGGAEILSGAGVRDRMDQAWTNTVNATTPTSRREEGYYIALDTSTGAYEATAHSIGTTFPNNLPASWNVVTLPRPADSIQNPTPLQMPVYTVAWIHTHTPTTYREEGRITGPTDPDCSWTRRPGIEIPGYAYDYRPSPRLSAGIPAGHPLTEAARVYRIVTAPNSGSLCLQRRATP